MLVRPKSLLSRIWANMLRLDCFVEHLRTVRHTQIFAQDHISCASRLIGSCPYTLIEDSPGVFSRFEVALALRAAPPRGAVAGFLSRILHGPVFGKSCGMNPQCVCRWVTQASDLESPALANRKAELLDLQSLWQSSSDVKKAEILRIFCGDDNPLDKPGARCDTLILTQPLIEDFGLTEDEMRAVYAPAVARYAKSGVAFKTHPRDGFDFGRNFPEAKPVDTLLPMQFLCMMGMRFKRVVTVSSSAVKAFPPSIEVDYIDVSGDRRLAVLGRMR